jgi:uncharacterized protein (UPF0128 family)
MELARTEYVTGEDSVTLESVAKKYKMSIQAVRQRSAREKWVAQREQQREQVRTAVLKKAASAVADIRIKQMKLGRQMQEIGAMAIAQYIISKDPETGKPIIMLRDPQEIRKFIAEGADIERKAAGLDERGGVLANLTFTPQDLEKMSDEEIDALYNRIKTALA